MKLLVVGFGSIGKRHIRNAKQIDPEARVAVWRQRSREADLGDHTPDVEHVVFEAEAALAWRPDMALITNPAAYHMETARLLAEEGVHLFIEKPLAHTLAGIDTLLECCRSRSLTLMVGYNFRFYHPLQILREAIVTGRVGRVIGLYAAVGQYLPDWRPSTDYRFGASACAELGGGAVLELSHEIDYLRWLGGEVTAVRAQIGRVSTLALDVEDAADIVFRFASGAFGNVHLDMVDRARTRWCRVVGTEGTLTLDMVQHEVRHYSGTESGWTTLHPAGAYDSNAMYVEELTHFFECVQSHRSPCVSGEDGWQVLRIAVAAKEAAERGCTVKL